MPGKTSHCPHVPLITTISWEEIKEKQNGQVCHVCRVAAPDLWLCIVSTCRHIGCGQALDDHSSTHIQQTKHCLAINTTTLRIWCSKCEVEVFPHSNDPKCIIRETRMTSSLKSSGSTDSSPHRSFSGGDDSESDMDDENSRPRGLTGLQNLGNTCYMNAALQSLSNCPPLTRFFLDCSGYVRPDKNPMLSRSYHRLVSELWHKKRRSYVVPSGVVSGIKCVHSMFKGYTQQDTQEFLRCFMDQLHEELKQPVVEIKDENGDEKIDTSILTHPETCGHDRQPSIDSSSSSSQSDFDYETCDSGLSSEKSSAHNLSGDEDKDINEQDKLKPPSVDENRSNIARSGCYDNVTSSIPNTKDLKETANLLCKHSVDSAFSMKCGPSGDYVAKVETGEFSDALTDIGATSQKSKVSNQATVECRSPSPKQLVINKSRMNHGAKGTAPSTHYRSVISDIFDGKILSSVMCLTCERVSTTKETFQDLSLPIPSKEYLHVLHSNQHSTPGATKGGSCGEAHQTWLGWMFSWMRSWFMGPTITLQDCLSAFFSADELKGDNMYSCEKCKKLRNGLKYSKVLELPEILCIHLKRFRHEFYSSKIGTYVAFPLEGLDMKSYLHKDCKSEVMIYNLVAVICHHGTAGGGHYTAYCLNYINEQWYEFDDQYVTEVDVQQVINCEAYVLFYRKKNEKMHLIRQRAMELMDEREPSLMQFFVSREWINKFNTFSEPGSITNSDFLCTHGGVPPNKVNHINDLVQCLGQPVWDYLYNRYGGGPACNHLYACDVCQSELDKMRHRQKTEIDTFIQLNEEFQAEEHSPVIYAISMAWFKQWEGFVRLKCDTPPGEIDNSTIAIIKGGQPQVKQSSDYGQLSKEMWQFLYNIYGGGPELILRQSLAHVAGKTTNPTMTSGASTVTTQTDRPVSSSSTEKTDGLAEKLSLSESGIGSSVSDVSERVTSESVVDSSSMSEKSVCPSSSASTDSVVEKQKQQ